ncbi:glycoside hydrolase TIM-barrel-like domain-containing protein [Gymnodinialimonas sp. 2305UL16-5]|uniref:baseplate multidomain protein megatron n=1 Tax=Gymnodinialimonas mytili TaxID=3126503 RepID=UPI0030A5477E
MATILLSAAGAAAGGLIQAPILGMSGAVLGRAVGATLGRVIDQRLLGSGSEPVEVGRTDRLRITGAGEGGPIAESFGRTRMGGHVIWSTQFLETSTTTGGGRGGGKGGPPQPQTTTYSYSISLAVALCEGEISRVGRIWADGVEIDRTSVIWRLYKGTPSQMPDPLLEAVEGAGTVPAYRGIAYVVFENLDLTPYGNRVPQFAFEVVRPARPSQELVPAASDLLKAVALMPGTGEYALAVEPISLRTGLVGAQAANVSAQGGTADFNQSLAQLRDGLPNLESVSLIYSWFGDDLRAGSCTVRPKVEDRSRDSAKMPWRSGGIGRAQAQEIARVDGRPVYGGTPTDQSVIQAIQAIHAGGQQVTFYPFLLMEQLVGNGLPDPYGAGEQAYLPWRGRITGDIAPTLAGSPDGTAANRAAVDAFFGSAIAAHFAISGATISYNGPAEWSYSRFILHCAALCAAAGGVEAFCIGSEMRGLTQMRDDIGFPAVDRYIALAAQVRALLPGAKITYAADWTEYFGYQPQDGSGDVYFHLDPLWADPNIDVIAIDNYMPLSDWREGGDHLDHDLGPIHSLRYLKSGIEGGEGYDWFYASPADEASQTRSPITDGWGDPWVYRYKDLRNWWLNPHVERRGGVPLNAMTVNGGSGFSPYFAGSAPHWIQGDAYPVVGLAAAANALDFPDVESVAVSGEGDVLQIGDTARVISERGWRPFIAGQRVQVTIRTRVLSEPSDGFDHRHDLSIATHDATGAAGATVLIDTWSGLRVSDGWVERVVTVQPDILRGQNGVAADASGWRLAIGLNGATTTSAAGAVQQIARIDVDALGAQSPWVPQSKPIWFTEFGCAAIDKGPNQPNRFLDPKSAESGIPKYSNGRRDDLVQVQYLRAILDYWETPGVNPQSSLYGGPMLDMSRAHAWAWDARPWPAFPNDQARWSDGANWTRGHWLTGRIDAQPLELVVAQICEEAGIRDYDVSALQGLVRGIVSGNTQSARARLQPLMMAHGFSAVERDGKIVFLPNVSAPQALLDVDTTALDEDGEGGFTYVRAPNAEAVGRLRLGYTDAEGEYAGLVSEAVFPGDDSDQVDDIDLPMSLTQTEAQATAERWLAEGRVAQDTLRFALPPSTRAIGAGAMVETRDGQQWRIDRIDDRGFRQIEAVRVEPSAIEPSDEVESIANITPFVPPLPVTPVFMDLPLLTGDEVEHAPHLAVAADPWPGSVAVYDAPGSDGYALNSIVENSAIIGLLEMPMPAAKPGLWDRSGLMQVRLETGALSSAEQARVLSGANAAALGAGSGGDWEVIQFAEATLVAPDLWEIGLRLRGQQGTDAIMPPEWPVGTLFVLLDGAVNQVNLSSSARGLERYWRVGPAQRSVDDDSYTQFIDTFQGVGLRPYRPVHLRAQKGAGGHFVSWIRRSRIDADSWDGTDVPLGEASEQYLLRVSDASATRREELLTSPNFIYTDAARAADGTQSSYTIEVAQVSERFGPGPFARIEIND